jgi:hypothetical protein
MTRKHEAAIARLLAELFRDLEMYRDLYSEQRDENQCKAAEIAAWKFENATLRQACRSMIAAGSTVGIRRKLQQLFDNAMHKAGVPQ